MTENLKNLLSAIGIVVLVVTFVAGVMSYLFLLSDVREIHDKICGKDKEDKP